MPPDMETMMEEGKGRVGTAHRIRNTEGLGKRFRRDGEG